MAEIHPVTIVKSTPAVYGMTMRRTGIEEQPLALILIDQSSGSEMTMPLTVERIWWLHESTRLASPTRPTAGLRVGGVPVTVNGTAPNAGENQPQRSG